MSRQNRFLKGPSFGLPELAPSPKHPIPTLVCLMLCGPGSRSSCRNGWDVSSGWWSAAQGAFIYRGEISTTWFSVKQKCTVIMSAGESFLALMSHREWNCWNHLGFPTCPNRKGIWLYKLSIHFHNQWADRTIICQILAAICYNRYVNKPLDKGTVLFQTQPFVILAGEKVHWFASISPPILQQTDFGSWNPSCFLCCHCRHQISTAAWHQGKFFSCWIATF